MYTCLSLQDAIHNEHGRDFMGARIVVEWARGPKVHKLFLYQHPYPHYAEYSGTCLKRQPWGPKLLAALERWSYYAGSTECKRGI